MKYLALITFTFLFYCTTMAQRIMDSKSCVTMYGSADVDYDGCWYNSVITNGCNQRVLVKRSVFEAKFEYTRESGDELKTYKDNKKIKTPDVFLDPGSSVTKDKDRSDNSSKTYTRMIRIQGELGNVYECSSEKPVENAMLLSLEEKTPIGSMMGVEFYFEVNKALDSWPGFSRYKVSLVAKNTSSNKVKPKAFVDYKVYFEGVAYEGDIRVSSIRGGQEKKNSEKEDPIFNFVPAIYLEITGTNIDLN